MGKRVWGKKALLQESLLGLAKGLGPGQRLPTVGELCRSFRTSSSTLDMILKELELQGAIVREHGRGLFVSPTIHVRTIGVVFGGNIFAPPFSPFWGLLLQAAQAQAGDHAFRLRSYLDLGPNDDGGPGGQSQLSEDLEAKRLDGMLLLSPHYQYDEAAQLRAYGRPVVVFGGKGEGLSVQFDFAAFLGQAAQAVASAPCRRIGFIGDPTKQPVLREALQRNGLAHVEVDDWSYHTWAEIIPGAGDRENCAHLMVQRLLADAPAKPLPDVLLSLGDTATRGALAALQQGGLEPGRDIRVISAENVGSPVLFPYADRLTTIQFDPTQVIHAALDMLETVLDGKTPPTPKVLVPPVSLANAYATSHEGVTP